LAFTQADLDSIDTALVALSTGRRVVSVVIAGERIEYAAANVDDLLKLRGIVSGAVQSISTSGIRVRGIVPCD
jgi:hypothetical protein